MGAREAASAQRLARIQKHLVKDDVRGNRIRHLRRIELPDWQNVNGRVRRCRVQLRRGIRTKQSKRTVRVHKVNGDGYDAEIVRPAVDPLPGIEHTHRA